MTSVSHKPKKRRIHSLFRRIRQRIASFTIVELLIVIAILAVLAAAVVVILNPGELLAQTRDSKRISDLNSIASAMDILVVDKATASLGSANTVYISIPDTSSTCANVTGLPALPSGWSYHCSPSTDLKKIDGTGWIPLDLSTISGGSPLPSLPVDPKNDATSFYQYVPSGNKYEVKATVESVKYQDEAVSDGGISTQYEKGSSLNAAPLSTQDNWIKVPGNGEFGTSDFWVMKYEAKCASTSTGTPLTSPEISTFKIYDNWASPCTSANGRYVVSSPFGYPIALVSHNTAKTYCQSIGAHLITNEEWMTIARNAESMATNWTGGAVGSGSMYVGHYDTSPFYALEASASDSDGYFGQGLTSGTKRRTFNLSNGTVIWDMAGNLYEHVMRGMADDQSTIPVVTCSTTSTFCEYNAPKTPYITNWNGGLSFAQVGQSNASWNSDNGTGGVYMHSTSTPGNVILRSGSFFSHPLMSSIYAVFMGWSATADNDIIFGFRCAK